MSFTNAQLAQQIADLIEYWNDFYVEYANWQAGEVDGGLGSDGKYPLTNYLGEETSLECPAHLADAVTGTVAVVAASAAAAATSETNAGTSETNAGTSESNAETFKDAAAASVSAASVSEGNAASSQTVATAQAALAAADAAAAAASVALLAQMDSDQTVTGSWKFVGPSSSYLQIGDESAAVGFSGLDIYAKQGPNNWGARLALESSALVVEGLGAAPATQIRFDMPYIYFASGAGMYFQDSTGTDTSTFRHYIDRFQLDIHPGDRFSVASDVGSWFGGGGDVQCYGGGDIWVRDGGNLKVSDTDDTDFVAMSHAGAGGDFNFVGTNTTDINMTSGITSVNVSLLNGSDPANWDTAYGWGDHASTYELIDATLVRDDDAGYNNSDWDTAFGWGDHASGGYETADADIAKTDVTETVTAIWDFTGIPTINSKGVAHHISTGYTSGKITVASSAPGTPAQGDIWFDTT